MGLGDGLGEIPAIGLGDTCCIAVCEKPIVVSFHIPIPMMVMIATVIAVRIPNAFTGVIALAGLEAELSFVRVADSTACLSHQAGE